MSIEEIYEDYVLHLEDEEKVRGKLLQFCRVQYPGTKFQDQDCLFTEKSPFRHGPVRGFFIRGTEFAFVLDRVADRDYLQLFGANNRGSYDEVDRIPIRPVPTKEGDYLFTEGQLRINKALNAHLANVEAIKRKHP